MLVVMCSLLCAGRVVLVMLFINICMLWSLCCARYAALVMLCRSCCAGRVVLVMLCWSCCASYAVHIYTYIYIHAVVVVLC